MKYTFITLFLLLCTTVGYSQSETFVSAGASYNTIQGVDASLINSLGYYAGFGQIETFKRVSVTAEVQVLQQHIKNDDITGNATSINLFVHGGLQPTKLPIKVIAGAQMGFTVASQIQQDDGTEKGKGPRFSLMGGIAYRISRYEISGRYYRTVDGIDMFDHTIQAGVSYFLKK